MNDSNGVNITILSLVAVPRKKELYRVVDIEGSYLKLSPVFDDMTTNDSLNGLKVLHHKVCVIKFGKGFK